MSDFYALFIAIERVEHRRLKSLKFSFPIKTSEISALKSMMGSKLDLIDHIPKCEPVIHIIACSSKEQQPVFTHKNLQTFLKEVIRRIQL